MFRVTDRGAPPIISRVGHPDHLCFALLPDPATGEYRTRNVVYKDALTCSVAAAPPTSSEPVSLEYDAVEDEMVAAMGKRPATPGMDFEDAGPEDSDEE